MDPLEFKGVTATWPEGTLADWWATTTIEDIQKTLPKIEEYGTLDLTAMGQFIANCRATGPAPELGPDEYAVYGTLFYAVGKIARAVASLERGEMPTHDTLFDLSVYSMMARAYVERGGLQ